MSKGGVYKIKCLKNGRIYFGRSNTLQARGYAHKAALHYGNHDCSELQSDFNKYGENAFEFTIIKETNSIKIQSALERQLMKENHENLYNSFIGSVEDFGNQIVVRITDKLDKTIEKAAKSKGLTKASWVRQLIIETFERAKND